MKRSLSDSALIELVSVVSVFFIPTSLSNHLHPLNVRKEANSSVHAICPMKPKSGEKARVVEACSLFQIRAFDAV